LNIGEFYYSDTKYYIGIVRDISERKIVEEELLEAKEKAEKSTRLKSEFLASMSHEIRTPMNGIIGAHHLLFETPLSDKQQELIEISHSSAKALLALINDILDFSKIEADKLKLDYSPFDMHSLIKAIVDMIQVSNDNKNLAIVFDYEADAPRAAIGDDNRIKQILLNLVNNAVKFTKDGEVRVKVRASEQRNKVNFLVEIKDTGIGISEANIKNIFGKFEQANQSTTREFGGTGLGLAISKKLSEMMGGEIGVNSTLGVGSTFWLKITLEKANINDSSNLEIEKRNKIVAPENQFKGSANKTILVAEDNEINRVILNGLLEQFPCKVTMSQNGKEALELASTQSYDLIFMDCQMPVMDGFDATKAIRAHEKKNQKPLTPIIAFTANAIIGDKEKCFDAGMDDYLSKPIDPDALKKIIHKWL